MAYREPQFVNDEFYHIVVKAGGDNLLFKDIDDHYRGIFSIYEFNTTTPITIREQRKIRAKIKEAEKEANRGPTSDAGKVDRQDKRDKIVEVIAFCFVPNHIHLLLRQLKDGGITTFMRKLGTGLGGYLNRKYGKEGHVFQKSFTAVLIKTNEQLINVFVYIHTNSIALIEPGWKEKGIKDPERALKFLEEYKWSSYPDYIGKKNFPSVTDRDFMLKVMGGPEGCRGAVEQWVKYKAEIRKFPVYALE